MAMIEAAGRVLILKRASVSRPSGQWNDDDFDVLADGVVVGRIPHNRESAAYALRDSGRATLTAILET
jgi:hypothetical protein